MSIDRIFLDADILFSVAHGSPGLNHLWELAQKGSCVLLASEYVIEEAKTHAEKLMKEFDENAVQNTERELIPFVYI